MFAEPTVDRALLDRVRSAGVPVHDLEDGALAKVADTVTPQGVMAVTARRPAALDSVLAAGPPVLVLVDVQDPGNVGTLLRTAEASGTAGAVVAGSSADPFGPKAVRASAGAVFHLPIAIEAQVGPVLETLRSDGMRIIATDAQSDTSVTGCDLTGAVAIVLGNEGAGLDPAVLGACDAVAAVPIEGRAESLNVAAAGAVVLFEARRQRQGDAFDIVSAVSHELRSPLTSIQGYTGMLLNRWDRFSDEQKRLLLEEMHDDAGRVGRLVGELLDVSRLESGRLRLQHQPVDLPDLARAAVDRVQLTHPDLDVRVEFPDDWPGVRGDPDKLQQVLLNLVENAAKYADPGGVRIVGSRPDAGHVAVTVADRGPGIPPEDLDRVFTKFFRREDQRPSGIGLGLWISRGVLEAHGGTLTASSKMGTGSEFCLTLPVT